VRFDLQTRTTYALLFGMFSLLVMLIGAMFGAPVNEYLAGIFGSFVLGAIGVEAWKGGAREQHVDPDGRDPKARPAQNPDDPRTGT
jgi:putative Mn2+ efflux pump MntP